MDTRHLRHHLQDLAGRQRFLRALKPGSDRYKLWLGDVVELVNNAYGPDSPQMAELRALLTGRPRLPAEATDAERERDYLERLDAIAALLARFERASGDPIIFVEPNGR